MLLNFYRRILISICWCDKVKISTSFLKTPPVKFSFWVLLFTNFMSGCYCIVLINKYIFVTCAVPRNFHQNGWKLLCFMMACRLKFFFTNDHLKKYKESCTKPLRPEIIIFCQNLFSIITLDIRKKLNFIKPYRWFNLLCKLILNWYPSSFFWFPLRITNFKYLILFWIWFFS